MDLMGILGMIAIGFVVGLIAKFLTPGRDPAGFFATIAIGIVGSLVATYGGQALGFYTVGQTAGFIASVVGAVLLLVVIKMFRGNG